MSLHTDEAIVLQSYDTGETSSAVRVLTPARGRGSLMAKGLRRKGSRLAGVLQPLARVQVVYHHREGAEMGTLRDASPLGGGGAPLQADLERFALGCLLAEAAAESVEEGQPAEHPYGLLVDALAALSPSAARHPSSVAARALLRLLGLAGFEPAIDPALLRPWRGAPRPLAFWLDLREGRIHLDGAQPREAPDWPVLPPAATRHFPLPPAAVRAIHESRDLADEGLFAAPPLSSPHACQLVAALARFAEAHFDRPLRSVRFWRGIIGA